MPRDKNIATQKVATDDSQSRRKRAVSESTKKTSKKPSSRKASKKPVDKSSQQESIEEVSASGPTVEEAEVSKENGNGISHDDSSKSKSRGRKRKKADEVDESEEKVEQKEETKTDLEPVAEEEKKKKRGRPKKSKKTTEAVVDNAAEGDEKKLVDDANKKNKKKGPMTARERRAANDRDFKVLKPYRANKIDDGLTKEKITKMQAKLRGVRATPVAHSGTVGGRRRRYYNKNDDRFPIGKKTMWELTKDIFVTIKKEQGLDFDPRLSADAVNTMRSITHRGATGIMINARYVMENDRPERKKKADKKTDDVDNDADLVIKSGKPNKKEVRGRQRMRPKDVFTSIRIARGTAPAKHTIHAVDPTKVKSLTKTIEKEYEEDKETRKQLAAREDRKRKASKKSKKKKSRNDDEEEEKEEEAPKKKAKKSTGKKSKKKADE